MAATDSIKQFSDKASEKVKNLTTKQKIGIGIGVAVLIIAIIIAAVMLRPQYKVLLSEDVEASNIAALSKVFDENSIKYRLINDSTNIAVRENQYEQAKMLTASSGVMETGMTLEDLLKNDLSTTKDQMNLKSREYLKDSIQKTLVMIDGIDKARVELVIPEEKNAYIQSKVKSNASIFLTTSQKLSPEQCDGIATYVASSVPNLAKEDIVIMDASGNTLFSGAMMEENNASASLDKQQEMKITAENEIKKKVVDLYSNIFDDVKVSPNLVLNFDQYQEQNENYTSQSEDTRGVVGEETEDKSSSTGTSQSAGSPGTNTNGGDLATYQVEDQNNTTSTKDSSKNIKYLPNKQNTVYIKNVGDVDLSKSSIAVNLIKNKVITEEQVKIAPDEFGDGSKISWEKFKVQNREQKPITDFDTVAATKLISNATGIPEDKVTVSAYENPVFFDKEPYSIEAKDWLPYLLLVVVLVAIAFIIVRFKKQNSTVEVEPELEVEAMINNAKHHAELEEIEVKETLESKRQIDKFVDEKPEAVANLLKNWLSDDEE